MAVSRDPAIVLTFAKRTPYNNKRTLMSWRFGSSKPKRQPAQTFSHPADKSRRMPNLPSRLTAPCALLALAWLGGLFNPIAAAAEPLHVRIDQHVEKKLDFAPAPTASDAEFVRRVYLDLVGRIPTVGQAKEFFADTSAGKRARLIDRLLDSPDYARRMQHVFDIWLLERREEKAIPTAEWQAYLRKSFAENKPYNVLAREILAADGVENRPAVKFYLARAGETNVLTRDVGRLFLGMDVQCAQCHDHPLIEDYSQTDYYGIYAYLNRSFIFNDPKEKKTFFAEKAEGEVAFKSVFNPSVNEQNFRPRLRTQQILEEPALAKGQEYFVAPSKGNDVRPIPRFSRRQQLAIAATEGTNTYFNANIVNRLWHLMMGRGLVHPPGLHHAENPPTHPELLDELAREFVASKFDVKAMLRELALSKTYQRSSEVPQGMTAEQSAPGRYAVALLRPLSPEQMAWSLMEAAGMCEAQRTAEAQQLNADPRLRDMAAASTKARYLRDRQIEEKAYAALAGNVPQFVNLYGGNAGEPEQDFQASVHQALFVANGPTVRTWLATLATRLQAVTNPGAAADELYLAALSRLPSEEERAEVIEYLVRRTDNRAAGIQEIAWALVASAEFRFNH
jgi:hypothetical protein